MAYQGCNQKFSHKGRVFQMCPGLILVFAILLRICFASTLVLSSSLRGDIHAIAILRIKNDAEFPRVLGLVSYNRAPSVKKVLNAAHTAIE
jgi:hypothetical protein